MEKSKAGLIKSAFTAIIALAMVLVLIPSMNMTVKATTEPNYLTFTAQEAGSTVSLKSGGSPSIKYSLDGGNTWTAYNHSTGETITLENIGDAVCFKGTGISTDAGNHFTMTGKIAASGSVTSLLDENGNNPDISFTALGALAPFKSMFKDCAALTSAPELPALTLSSYCYDGMFEGCTGLTSAPELPATTLAECCYFNMFKGCVNLTSVPELPATTLAKSCYKYMFWGCTNIELQKNSDATHVAEWKIPATEDASDWNFAMFYDCPKVNLNGSGGKTVSLNTVYYQLSSHIHDWSYTVKDGNKIEATCGESGDCYITEKPFITITVEDATYTGEPIGATVSEWSVEESSLDEVPTITYVGREGTSYESTTAPSAVGKYIAQITVGDATAKKDFEIEKLICPVEPIYLKEKAVSPSKAGASDGKITDVTEAMEYSLDDGKTWKAVTGTEITGLKAGEVLVRVKETETVKAGYIVKVTVPDGKNDTPDGDDGNVKVPEDKQNGNFEAGGIKNSVAEVKAAVLTAEDKAAIEAGKDVSVWVEVKDQTATVAKADKTKVEEKLDKDFAVGTYLDVTLWKQITGSDANKVTDVPNGKVKIGFTIPKDLQKANRTYKIVRVHDGVAEIIDAVVDAEFGLTFETDRFSTYALIYTDADVTKPAETPAKTPGTGDTSPIALYVLMMGLAGVAMLVSKKRRAVR